MSFVKKRDGSVVPYDMGRIMEAIAKAAKSVGRELDADEVFHIAHSVDDRSEIRNGTPSVERIQDLVELALMQSEYLDVAKAYILYREEKAKLRPSEYGDSGISDYIVMSKYSRYREDLGRRELWPEATKRVFDMHRDNFSTKLKVAVDEENALSDMIALAEAAVLAKDVLPSMRTMQFGGSAILTTNFRAYNCVSGYIDTPRRFAEAMWLLLCGCGVGFSIQTHHVAKLPTFPVRGVEDDLQVVHHRIADTIEGWAEAVDALVQSHYNGTYVEFDFSAIRPKGAPLHTSGGKAPGHLSLKKALASIREVLRKASGRHLRPIEAYDIVMFCASAVISGGIRRSATIALFSPDDEEMVNAKTGEWWKHNPQRQHSNNSAVLVRSTSDRSAFDSLFQAIKQYGEPGFLFTDSSEYTVNPCVEISKYPTLQVDQSVYERLVELGESRYTVGDEVTGWQACNLSTINGARCQTEDEFYRLCVVASVIGTLQAAYTNSDYLGPVSQVLLEREALLGVSICGILENPHVLLQPNVLRRGAEIVKFWNKLMSRALGTNEAARTTCVKPEGSASLVLNTGSGIHPRHAKRYFRRVQAARTEPVYQYFKDLNPQMVEAYVMKADTTDVITFPVVAPNTAIVKSDINAIDFLNMVKLVQENWVIPGTVHEDYAPGARHNVSNTVTVNPDEWDAVADFIWENRSYFTGVSILAASGDKDYMQAPNEEVTTADDIRKWNLLQPVYVDYSKMFEASDATDLQGEAACAAGGCDVL